jgi:sortase A
MRVVVVCESLSKIMRWTQRLLFASAVLTLGYCGLVVIDSWSFQRAERRQFEQLLPVRQTTGHPEPTRAPGKYASPALRGDLIGLIKIPRLDMSVIVVEGTTASVLRRAAGHIPGTALPGQVGNVGISGHRDTFFQPLEKIRPSDLIVLTTLVGEYHYRVVSTKIVSPYDVAVLKNSGAEILTLVTCYPFYYVGPAPDRFIVRAERII